MIGRERFLNALRGSPVDYPSAAPYMGNFCLHAADYNLAECYTQAETMARAQLDAWKIFGQDVIVVQSDNYYMAEAFGAPVRYEDDSLPVLEDAIIKKPEDVYKLTPQKAQDGRMPIYIEAMKRIVDHVDNQAAVRGCGTGPFVLAGHLCGIERLMTWIAETEAGLSDHTAELNFLFRVGLETLLVFASAQLEAGATVVQLADSLASINVISPEVYRKLVFPYEKEFFERIAPLCKRNNSVALLHICGDNTPVFEDFVQTGADILEVDHAADLDAIFGIVANRTALIGNMNPAGELLTGSPQEVAAIGRSLLDRHSSGRYVLGTGCEVSVDTPRENIESLLDMTRNYNKERA